MAWRVTLRRTDTTLDHSQKAGKKRSWDIPGKGDTLHGMAWRGMALHRRWHWRWRCFGLGRGLGVGDGDGVGIGIGIGVGVGIAVTGAV